MKKVLLPIILISSVFAAGAVVIYAILSKIQKESDDVISLGEAATIALGKCKRKFGGSDSSVTIADYAEEE